MKKLIVPLLITFLFSFYPLEISSPSSLKKSKTKKIKLIKTKEITVSSTAYCLRGRTATGTIPQKGTVAVDPRIIKLGSILFVEKYGWAKAEDVGPAIKGNKIDIWLPTKKEALKWGVRKVKVVVYEQVSYTVHKNHKKHFPKN